MDGNGERLKAGRWRWALGLVAAVAALVLCRWWILEHQAVLQALSPGCYFRRVSGCYCPGCGGTRAFFALLKGQLCLSLRMNPLLLSGLAVGGFLALIHGAERLSKGRLHLSNRFRATPAAGWWLAGAMVAFWILRNLPGWPFTLLAPIHR